MHHTVKQPYRIRHFLFVKVSLNNLSKSGPMIIKSVKLAGVPRAAYLVLKEGTFGICILERLVDLVLELSSMWDSMCCVR